MRRLFPPQVTRRVGRLAREARPAEEGPLEELDVVELVRPLGPQVGDRGTVVEVGPEGTGLVEFTDDDGRAEAFVEVDREDVEVVAKRRAP